jgi:hypothetical protein
MKWFFSPHKSNKKAVEVVRNHKVMVSAFFLLSHLLSWLFHVINSSDNTCFIFIFLDRFFFTGWDEMEFRISNYKVKVAIRDHFFSCWNAPMWLKKSCFISLSPYMLVCVLIYVVFFVTSLAHLRSGSELQTIILMVIHHFIFFQPPVMSFFPYLCVWVCVSCIFLDVCACVRVCVCVCVCVKCAFSTGSLYFDFRTGCFRTCWRLSLFCYAQHLFFLSIPLLH